MTDWSAVSALAAVGTGLIAVAALVVAGIAAWAALRTNQAQQETLELQREQSEAAQAAKVTFFISDISQTQRKQKPDGKWTTVFIPPHEVRFFNGSDTPVFGLILWEDAPNRQLLYASRYLFPGPDPQPSPLTNPKSVPTARCKLYFRDSAGVAWVRDDAGALAKATPDEASVARALFDEQAGEFVIDEAMLRGGPAMVERIFNEAIDAADHAVPWDGFGPTPPGYWSAWADAALILLDQHTAGRSGRD